LSYWDKIKNWVWALCTFTILAALMVIFVPEYQRYRRNVAELAMQQAEQKKEDQQLQKLKDDLKRFKNEPAFVERIAHEHGMVKPGEILFKFVDENDRPLER
jgi:cell division protein FtsB